MERSSTCVNRFVSLRHLAGSRFSYLATYAADRCPLSYVMLKEGR